MKDKQRKIIVIIVISLVSFCVLILLFYSPVNSETFIVVGVVPRSALKNI